jgi:hypothetical protein
MRWEEAVEAMKAGKRVTHPDLKGGILARGKDPRPEPTAHTYLVIDRAGEPLRVWHHVGDPPFNGWVLAGE